jgi:hypothetical protein
VTGDVEATPASLDEQSRSSRAAIDLIDHYIYLAIDDLYAPVPSQSFFKKGQSRHTRRDDFHQIHCVYISNMGQLRAPGRSHHDFRESTSVALAPPSPAPSCSFYLCSFFEFRGSYFSSPRPSIMVQRPHLPRLPVHEQPERSHLGGAKCRCEWRAAAGCWALSLS